MAFSSSAATLAAVLAVLPAVAGCDRLTDAPADPSIPTVPDAAATIYVKGSAELSPGAPLEYRAQLVPGATSYQWTVNGAGVATVDMRGNSRFVAVTGQLAGPFVLRVTAFDDRQTALARGERALVVTE